MDLRQTLPGDQPKPQEKRIILLFCVLRQPLGQVNIRLLQHIGSINTRLQPVIHPQVDHSIQTRTVHIEQLSQRILFAGKCPLDKRIVFGFVTHHSPCV